MYMRFIHIVEVRKPLLYCQFIHHPTAVSAVSFACGGPAVWAKDAALRPAAIPGIGTDAGFFPASGTFAVSGIRGIPSGRVGFILRIPQPHNNIRDGYFSRRLSLSRPAAVP